MSGTIGHSPGSRQEEVISGLALDFGFSLRVWPAWMELGPDVARGRTAMGLMRRTD
jgi:hypothetical protein